MHLVHPPQRGREPSRVPQVSGKDHELIIKSTEYQQSGQLLDLQESGSQLAIIDEESVGAIVPPLAKSPQAGRINVIMKHRQEDQVIYPSMLKNILLSHKHVPSPLQLVVVALERSSTPPVSLPVNNLIAQEVGQGSRRSSALRLIVSEEQTTAS
jgi:hypothetical protein